MALTLSEPRVIERGPYLVVGAWRPYEGTNEGPGWAGADAAFRQIEARLVHRADSLVLGFLYRPHDDDPAVDADVHACFIGAEVTQLQGQPSGLAVTRFSGGPYVLIDCIGDTEDDAAGGVGEAINYMDSDWLPARGYRMGDACFAAGDECTPKPPYIETVCIKLEPID